MALLPGYHDTQHHSEIIWWQGLADNQTMYGGLWGWNPGDYNCASYPISSFDSLMFQLPDTSKVFCSSENHLGSGELFLAGGTQPGTENGARHAYKFDPGTNSWTQVDSMSASRPFPNGGRWYATSTTLAAGNKVLVTSGSQYPHIEYFSGLLGNDIAPADSALFRYGLGYNGVDDGAIRTSSTLRWPNPREGASAVFTDVTYVFGGKLRNGLYTNEAWHLNRKDNAFGADYDYAWSPLENLDNPPAARWEHSAITAGKDSAWVIVFGGVRKNLGQDVVLDDVWRLHNEATFWQWTLVQIQSSPESPGPRWGHAAIFHAPSRRMLMFGGRGATTGSPTDGALWALNFAPGFSTATWQKLSATGPSPRFDHAVSYDTLWREFDTNGNGSDTTVALLFGGDLGGGSKANDLWKLHIGPDTAWRQVTLGGTPPSPRSGHTLAAYAVLHTAYVFGGSTTDKTVYVTHVDPPAGVTRQWSPLTENSVALRNHTAILKPNVIFERVPEVYNDSTNSWTRLTNAPHLQDWYPQGFVWKPDTVFFSGPDTLSYKFSISGQSWTPFPNKSTNYRGGSAVMYRPGKVMKCGSRDSETGTLAPAIDTTKRIDLNAGTAAKWELTAKAMLPRVNHNLVLLPNGKVLVVGGTAKGGNDRGADPVFKPEIWDPDNSGGLGGWFGRDTLARHAMVRDYHSTALLLPDARILCAGGNADKFSRDSAEIFCPPYLFKSDGTLATRPPVNGSPQRVRYGAGFSVCLSANDSIAGLCLIRPAAVTHGFDQNQRYVPLSFTPMNYPTSNLVATAPADSSAAPPGDYLLFAVRPNGVPSIARWVRMGASWPSGDVTRPGQITDLASDFVSSNSVSLYWTASGDDGSAGTASYVDIRRSNSTITSSNFDSATPVNQPVPYCSGALQIHVVTGLAASHTYYFAMKFVDESGNKSLMSNVVSATTTCSGCGGDRAGLAPEDEASAHVARGARAQETGGAAPPTAALSGAGTALLVEATPGTNSLDVSLTAIDGESYEGHALSSGAGVLLKSPERDEVHYDLLPGDRFAFCTPERSARWVVLEPCIVEQVLTAIRGQDAAWSLDEARHSRLGDLAALLAAGSPPPLLPGDTLALHYSAAADSVVPPSGWFLLLDRPSAGATLTRAGGRRSDTGSLIPASFALRQNQPNPFNARTTIRFELPVGAMVKLEVFDLQGRRLSVLADRYYAPGYHSVEWDKRSRDGATAQPGVYFYRIRAGQNRALRRMVVLP
ncbi:MAG TPA: galactose oxidase-like domain-containing protein [Candidatus Eisenbacteria bacterium]|jgi:hypothetical protein